MTSFAPVDVFKILAVIAVSWLAGHTISHLSLLEGKVETLTTRFDLLQIELAKQQRISHESIR